MSVRVPRLLGVVLAALCLSPWPAAAASRDPRPLVVEHGGRWLGDAIAYGPHRDGQRPGGADPSVREVGEDLALLAPRYGLLRLYGGAAVTDTVLEAIARSGSGMKVLLGMWIEPESKLDERGRVTRRIAGARERNRRELERTVRLAREHAGVVLAIAVGNETQVSWSAHRVPTALLLQYLREVRSRTNLAVTTGDDYNFWNKPESEAVARECDLVLVHLHPLWNGATLEGALAWVQSQYDSVRTRHAGHAVWIGETGWATQRNDQGDQGKLMKGALGEAEQLAYLTALRDWVKRSRVVTFTFEAFDENWKGSEDPADVEKHWGIFRADRSPKPAAEVMP